MSIIKRAASFSAAVSFVFAFIATATFINLGSVSYADGNGSPDACLDKTANVIGSVEDSGSQVSYTVKSTEVVNGVCIKSGNNAIDGEKHSEVLTENKTYDGCYAVSGIDTQTVTVTRVDSSDCKDISHIDVIYANKDVNYCDPSERPRGMSIAEWLKDNKIDGADCFEYVLDQECGNFDVKLTKYPVFEGKPYSAVYTTNGKVELPANSFPAEFDEDENNGSVNVTWFIVGPEEDYLKGNKSGLPNYWDDTSKTVVVDTDCENDTPEEEEEGEVLSDVTPTPTQVVAPVGAVNAGAGSASVALSSVAGLVGSLSAVAYATTRFFKGE